MTNPDAHTLAEKTCTPCRGGVPPLTAQQAEELRVQSPEWALMDDAHRIERTFRFRDFRKAMTFVQEVGELAESEGHHPDVSFGWGYATVSLRTRVTTSLKIPGATPKSPCGGHYRPPGCHRANV
jgi:4a-hydroxytetrahydrobiopterin dehydratase